MLALSGPFENTITTLRPATRAASRKRKQKAIVKSRIVPRDGFPQTSDGRRAIAIQRHGAIQVAAVRVNGDRIGAIQASNEIRNGIGGVHETPIHVVAGIEQNEHIGARHGVRS